MSARNDGRVPLRGRRLHRFQRVGQKERRDRGLDRFVLQVAVQSKRSDGPGKTSSLITNHEETDGLV